MDPVQNSPTLILRSSSPHTNRKQANVQPQNKHWRTSSISDPDVQGGRAPFKIKCIF